MVKSMIAGVAGLRAHQTKMDVIGNNIANVNTYGYKSSRVAFQDALYQTLAGASNATDSYGGRNARQIGYGSTVGSIDVMHTRGSFAPTDNPLDCMINGNGYFLTGILTASNAGYDVDDVTALDLTRVGNFNFDGDGWLVDASGRHVYGFQNTTALGATPATYDFDLVTAIQIPLDGGSPPQPLRLTQISIGADGTVIGVDDNSNVIEVGKIAVANVPNPNALEMTQNSYFKAKANTGEVIASVAGENTTGTLQAGGLEMANVDLAKEFTDMITTQRGFQANTRIITVTDEMLQELVNIKR